MFGTACIALPRPIEASPRVRRRLEPTDSVTPLEPNRLESRFKTARFKEGGACTLRAELGAAGTPVAERETPNAASTIASNKIVPSRMALKPDAMPPQAVTAWTLRHNLKQFKIDRPLRCGTIFGRSDKYPTMRLVPSSSRLSDDGAAIARSLHDPEAFAEVFDRHFAFVHRYIARRAGRDRADDLAAQTFTVAFSHRGRYRDDLGTARPWLLGIATNLLRAEYRGDARVASLVERLGGEVATSSSGESLAGASSASEVDDRLTNALERLDPGQREALLLHALGELTYLEIADALAIPVGTVRSRISRACAALRAELEPPAVAGERRNHA